MKGTAHALTCIDSLPTAIRREINQLGGKYIKFPVTEIVVKQTFYVLHTTVNSQNLHIELVHETPCQLFQRIVH